ncbi:hypothetical protein POM88_025314 [Heracleum sosnowskyi]|uniref:EXS domain-containing protein n=1 Tax=Heracleum sosnowskyi TaxID=360622 RepID=A0AAD8MJP6_9APIA|nr:hypothetical protein POM88_025314 [Heracleum sosnowskyi]
MLINTCPMLLIAVLGCVYLHFVHKTRGNNVQGKEGSDALRRPMIVKGLGVVNGIELSFFMMFIALLIWSFSIYLELGSQVGQCSTKARFDWKHMFSISVFSGDSRIISAGITGNYVGGKCQVSHMACGFGDSIRRIVWMEFPKFCLIQMGSARTTRFQLTGQGFREGKEFAAPSKISAGTETNANLDHQLLSNRRWKVLDFQVSFLHKQTLITIVAGLEIIRRGIWNFYRLENEHLNNVGKIQGF